MEVFGRTDVGSKRTVNQDAFCIDRNNSMFIVADGMGGHQAGDLASRMAIRSIVDFISKQMPIDIDDQQLEDLLLMQIELFRSAVVCANSELFKLAEDRPELFGMGTTIDILKIVKGYALICHVGDSRVYRLANGVIRQLTKDHTQIQELIDQHQISQKDAEFSTFKNVITRALGGSEEIEVDTLIAPVHEGDVFLLCTDGLTGVMEDWEICEEYGMYDHDLEEATKGLIETTLERGAPDNVTVLIVGPVDESDSVHPEREQDNASILADVFGQSYLS